MCSQVVDGPGALTTPVVAVGIQARSNLTLLGCLHTIADAVHGEEIAWLGWIGLDLTAQPAYVGPQILGLSLVCGAPHRLKQGAVGEHAAGI